MVVTSDDMGDAHVVVVDHDGQHIHRGSVGSHEDAVVEILVGPGHAALYFVVEHRLAVERGAKAQHGLDVGRSLARIAIPPTAVVAGRALFAACRLAHLLELGGCRVAAIGAARVEHLLRHLLVALGALRLVDDVAVPIEAEPAQPVEDRVDGGRRRAFAVGILDPQQHGAAVPPRVKPVEQGRPGASDVEETRRRRREARDHGLWHDDSQILER